MKNKSTTLQGVITFFLASSVVALVIILTVIALSIQNMLRKIYKVLPLFVVQWLASRKCEVIIQGKEKFYSAFKDTLFKVEDN